MRLLALLVLVVALWPTAAAAQTVEVVAAGWDGAVVPGAWSPVRARVTGGQSDAVARVEVELRGRVPVGPQGTPVAFPLGAYGQELPLPAGVTKDVTLWVPADPTTGGRLVVRVDGRVVAEKPVDFRESRSPFWALVGVMADQAVVGRAVGAIELPFEGLPIELSVARLSAADLPVRAERLEALSALVVQGNAAAGLGDEQRQAVAEWVEGGGHLLLLGGPDGPRAAAALPGGLLRADVQLGAGATDIAQLARWAGAAQAPPPAPAAGIVPRGGTALVGAADAPLVWRQAHGQGTITVLAVDPSIEPLASWPGTPALLKKALEPALPTAGAGEKGRFPGGQMPDAGQRLGHAAQGLPPEAFPARGTVALVLLGFALLVGPVLHLLLWRADRRGWLWGAVPAAALALAAGLYAVGIGREGRDVIGNVVAHARLGPGGGQQAIAAGFWSPTRPHLTVTVPGEAPVRVGTSTYYGGPYGPMGVPAPGATEPPFRVIGGRDTRVELAGGEWSLRVVSLERPLDGDVGAIEARLGLVDGLIRGTVRNGTPYAIEDAAVLVGGSVARIGALGPGQSAPVVLDPAAAWNPMMGGVPLSWRLLGTPLAPLPPPGGAAPMPTPVPRIAVPAPAPIARPRAVPPYPPPAAGQTAAAYPAPPGGQAAATPGQAATPAPGAATTPADAAAKPPTARNAVAVAPPPAASAPGGFMPPMGPPQVDLPRDAETQRRVRLVDAVVNVPSPFGPPGMSLPLTFMGFTRAPVGGGYPSAGGHPLYHLTLLEQPLRLDLGSGPFTLPASLTPAELADQSGGLGGGGNGVVMWVELFEGSATYAFRPPLPERATVSALTVTTQQIGPSTPIDRGRGSPPPPNLQSGASEEGVFAVLNLESGAWEPLPAGEAVRLQPAAAYVAPEGVVQVRVTAPAGRTVRFVQPTLTVEGVAP